VITKSVDFFEQQFRVQSETGDDALNPFEIAALPFLQGRVLDFGCGMGNLAVAAARRGCSVLALDASPTAIRHLQARAQDEALAIEALQADLRSHVLHEDFDAVVAIGLLMYFDAAAAQSQLEQLKARLREGGIAVVNVLIEATTYRVMLDPNACHLYARDELREAFAGWEIVSESFEDFPAPDDTVKAFSTVIARKPGPG
jgi:tellurite methyltransferase